jgi:thiamine biosynthesis protein ThiS
MTITVNGDARELPTGATVAQLLEELKFTPRNVAVELNRRLLRSDRYTTQLTEGDAVEIVTFVGGGC